MRVALVVCQRASLDASRRQLPFVAGPDLLPALPRRFLLRRCETATVMALAGSLAAVRSRLPNVNPNEFAALLAMPGSGTMKPVLNMDVCVE